MAYFNGRKILNARVEMVNGGYEEGYTDGYNAGVPVGFASGRSIGITEGKAAEWNAFWDVYQQNGKKSGYPYCFYGLGWTSATFKPKYDFDCGTNSYAMFCWSDIVEIDKVLDLSKCTMTHQMFQQANKLKTIKLMKVSTNTVWQTNTFYPCPSLENIAFEGEIGTSISFANCPLLTAASVYSIVDHLKQYSAEDAGFGTKTLTISQTAWNNFMQNGETPEGMLANHGSWENYLTNIGWQLVLT